MPRSIQCLVLSLTLLLLSSISHAQMVNPTAKSNPYFEQIEAILKDPELKESLVLRGICCMLAPSVITQNRDENILDTHDLGRHSPLTFATLREYLHLLRNRDRSRSLPTTGEKSGITYSPKVGFLDVAHIRQIGDITHYLYKKIKQNQGNPLTIKVQNGVIVVEQKVPQDKWIDVSRAMAYDIFKGHEITTFWNKPTNIKVPKTIQWLLSQLHELSAPDFIRFSEHASSFSPEDLVSNFIGTVVAKKALLSVQNGQSKNFSSGFEHHLDEMLNLELAALSKPLVFTAMAKLNRYWFNFTQAFDPFHYNYLLRRNFSRTPWKVNFEPEIYQAETPPWLAENFSPYFEYYNYTHMEFGRVLPKKNFEKEIIKIKDAAKEMYGNLYDSPILLPSQNTHLDRAFPSRNEFQ